MVEQKIVVEQGGRVPWIVWLVVALILLSVIFSGFVFSILNKIGIDQSGEIEKNVNNFKKMVVEKWEFIKENFKKPFAFFNTILFDTEKIASFEGNES
tara:strand:+ start:231 stop:524 length:294 start_codon:yes stop_codon:yes gene_type:complete